MKIFLFTFLLILPLLASSATRKFAADLDNDKYYDPTEIVFTDKKPVGYIKVTKSLGVDCDDNNSIVHSMKAFYRDADLDGYGSAIVDSLCAVIAPLGYSSVTGDCNDFNATVHVSSTEICNNLDDDCNGIIDDGLTYITYYLDEDGDGFGNKDSVLNTCGIVSSQWVTDNTDCDDHNAIIHFSSGEICNDFDDDCDGLVDDSLPMFTYYPDENGDGFADNANIFIISCATSPPHGYVTSLAPKASITVTSTTTPLNPLIHGIGGTFLEDAKNVFYDIKAEPEFSRFKACNFQDALPIEAAPSHSNLYFANNTAGLNNTYTGYCFNYCGFHGKECQKNPPLFDDNCVLDGVGCNTYKDAQGQLISFVPYTIEACGLANIKTISLYYTFSQNYYPAYKAFAQFYEQQGYKVIHELGDENNITGYDNQSIFPQDATSYVNLATPVIASLKADFPNEEIIIDGAPFNQGVGAANTKWNKTILPLGTRFNCYLKDNDIFKMPVSKDFSDYVDTINAALDVNFPELMNKFKQVFPGATASVTSWGVSNGPKGMPYEGTLLSGQYAIAQEWGFWDYQNIVENAFYYRWSTTASWDTCNLKYWALYCNGKLVSPGASKCTLTTIPNCRMFASYNGSSYVICFANFNDYPIDITAIKADGYIFTSWSGESFSGTWEGDNRYSHKIITNSPMPANSFGFIKPQKTQIN